MVGEDSAPNSSGLTLPASIELLVMDSQQMVFEGVCTSVSSVNDSGPFDVLASHAQFITLIDEYLDLGLADGTKQRIEVDHGIMRVNHNRVTVFLGMKELHLDGLMQGKKNKKANVDV